MRKRRGIQFPSFNPVNFAIECPKHPGEYRLESPVGQFQIFGSGAQTPLVDYQSNRYSCPQGGGHSFNIEDAKATIYNDDGSIQASGVPINGSISASGLAVGSIYLG